MTGFIGGGNMAEALIKGMAARGMKEIIVSEPRGERREHLEKAYGVRATPDNLEAVRESAIIILAVKPQSMDGVLDEIKDAVTEEKAVVSIAAGIPLSYLEGRLRTKKLFRVMPNVAATVGEGMSAISVCECMAGAELNVVKEIFMSVGRVLMMPERQIDAVTALSGSGPAFIALFVDAMAKTGGEMGLTADDATALAVQTLRGTARLLDEGISPEKLVAMVKSPGGTTEAGLKVFDEKGLGAIVKDALFAARKRAEELAGARPPLKGS
jgi:pyrroline-5-carboxylate reductase